MSSALESKEGGNEEMYCMATNSCGFHPVGNEEPRADLGENEFSSNIKDSLNQTPAKKAYLNHFLS